MKQNETKTIFIPNKTFLTLRQKEAGAWGSGAERCGMSGINKSLISRPISAVVADGTFISFPILSPGEVKVDGSWPSKKHEMIRMLLCLQSLLGADLVPGAFQRLSH